MTTQDHGRLLGILHLVHGGLGALLLLVFVPIFLFVALAAGQEPGGGGASLFLLVFGLAFFVFFLLLAMPPLVAGYGLLKGKSWARTWGLVSAVVASMSFPFGTALCVYTLWFLFGEGRDFHSQARGPAQGAAQGGARPGPLGAGGPLGWEAREAAPPPRPGEYVPPRQPPDWRGEP